MIVAYEKSIDTLIVKEDNEEAQPIRIPRLNFKPPELARYMLGANSIEGIHLFNIRIGKLVTWSQENHHWISKLFLEYSQMRELLDSDVVIRSKCA